MSKLRDRIIAEIVPRVADTEKLFTAYDITMSLRAETPDENLPHLEIRRLVRGLFNGQDPCFESPDPNDPEICTPITIGGEDALCFHRQSRNANLHPAADEPTIDDDDDDGCFPTDPLLTTVVHPAVNFAANDDTSDDTVQTLLVVESEGRLNVPSALVRGSLGLRPGDDASVNIVNDKLVITAGGTGYVYTVTVRGNIRLSRDLLAKIAPAGTATFPCEAIADTITIG